MKQINNGHHKHILVLIVLTVSIASGICYTNLITGIIHGIVNGLIVTAPFFLFIYFLELFLRTKTYFKYITFFFIIVSVCTVIVRHNNLWNPSPSFLFRSVFYIEAPKSLTNIKTHTDYPGRNLIFRLKFNLSKADFDNIIKNFEMETFFKYDELNDSSDTLYERLGVSYLRLSDKLSWWDIKYIKSLPQYTWIDEHRVRTLWLYKRDNDNFTIYVSGLQL